MPKGASGENGRGRLGLSWDAIGRLLASLLVAALIVFIIRKSPLFSDSCAYLPASYEDQAAEGNCATNETPFAFLGNIWAFLDLHNGAVIAVFTIVLATYTVRLAAATDRLVADAATTAKRQLRAYVHIESWVVPPPGINFVSITLIIKNFGQTPAHEVETLFTCVSGPEMFDDTIRAKHDTKRISQQSLGPGGAIQVVVPLDGVNFAAVGYGQEVIWLFGHIAYRDAFKAKAVTNARYHCGGENFKTRTFTADLEGNDAA